ncbi:hypothetical protein [Streptomyces sp. SID13726]|nr:hypothetical protein [Streptomyces sp. SID13726]NEA98560.1 hypothetical protein [Streptomyces sp. SID13726]
MRTGWTGCGGFPQDFQVGLFAAIPALCAVIAMYVMSHFADRAPDRRP